MGINLIKGLHGGDYNKIVGTTLHNSSRTLAYSGFPKHRFTQIFIKVHTACFDWRKIWRKLA